MKLKELKDILRSPAMRVQSVIVYSSTLAVICNRGCSIEYAIKAYGECEVERISADDNYLVLTLK